MAAECQSRGCGTCGKGNGNECRVGAVVGSAVQVLYVHSYFAMLQYETVLIYICWSEQL